MPCNNCSQNNCSGCDVEVHICNQCPPAQPCDCPILGLSTDCSTYDQDPIECNDVVVVPTNTILSDALNNIVSWTCTKFSEVQNFFTLKNVGTGAGVYKGINLLGEKELKSITKTGSLVTITPSTNEIALSVDEEALAEFVTTNQSTYSASNAGTEGEGVFAAAVVTGANTNFSFKKLKSNTLSITATGTEISIEQPTTTVLPALYVNNLYTPTYEEWVSAGGNLISNPSFEYKGEGNLARPITDSIRYTSTVASTISSNTAIQNALDAYVGTGTRLAPQKLGQRIIVQDNRPNGGYSFAGDFNYTGLDIKIERSVLSTKTGFLLDVDDLTAFDDESAFVSIEIGKDTFLEIQGAGLNNTGSTIATTTYATSKTVSLKGEGTLYSATNDISKYLITSDPSSTSNGGAGSNNDGNLTFQVECKLRADYQGIWAVGGLSKIDIYGQVISGQLTNTVNVSLKAFHQTGGQVRLFQGSSLSFSGNTRTSVFTFTPVSPFTPTLIMQSTIAAGTATNLFEKTNTGLVSLEITNVIMSYSLSLTEVFESPNLWSVIFNNNILATGNIDTTKADLIGSNTRSAHNLIANRVIESLVKYGTRTAAEAALPVGSKFINTNSADIDPDTWFIDITMQ